MSEVIQIPIRINLIKVIYFDCRTNDEWISMDSPRLRPAQPIVTFEVAEKVLARWNDCRKFPATIKRVLDNGVCNNQIKLRMKLILNHF